MNETNLIDDFLENDPEMIECFIEESKSCLQTAKKSLILLKEEQMTDNETLMEEAFRSVHSIKSSAGFLSLEKLVRLSMVMEDILDQFRKGKLRVEDESLDTILKGIGVMDNMLQNIENIDEMDTTELQIALSDMICRK
nr:chemotaxis protein CheA [uncultured bacterium]